MEEMSYVFLFIFCHWRSFSPWWPLAFLNFPPPLQNFYVVLPTKRCLVWPFIARSSCLSLSFSVFQICRHDNWPKLILRQHCKQKQFPLSVFVFIDSLVFSALHKTPVAMRFPAKIISSCHTCMLIELFYTGMPVVGTYGRLGGRAYGHATTKFCRMHRLPNFLAPGSPLLARAPL